MPKLICPACGAEVTLEQLSQTAEMLALQRAQASFGADWPLIKEYLDLFRGKHSLKITKLLRLAREVWEMWQAGGFASGRTYYRVGREEFREALRGTCNQVSPGLTNHNYLKKVMEGAAEKTSQRQERELRKKEEGLRTTGRMPVPPKEEMPNAPKWLAELTRLNKALRKPGLTPEARAEAKTALERHWATGAGQQWPTGDGPEADP